MYNGVFRRYKIALIVGPIWLIGLAIVYYMKGFHKIDETPNSKLVKQNIPSLLLGRDVFISI